MLIHRHRSMDTLGSALYELENRVMQDKDISRDPIIFPKQYKSNQDKELIGWIASHLAYGRVTGIHKAIEQLIGPLGDRPSNIVLGASEAYWAKDYRASIQHWKWRFHKLDDMIHWIKAWVRIAESGGLERRLLPNKKNSSEDQLGLLIEGLRETLPMSYGLRFNLPNPMNGSTAKRWRMMIRWFVRSSWPDLGIWKKYPTQNLIIPVDVHVARITGYLGIHSQKVINHDLALRITEALKNIDPIDPLRFDYPLAHMGIDGNCPQKLNREICSICPFYRVCSRH